MRFLLPQGIGDSVWGMLKVQAISSAIGDGSVEIFLNTANENPNENRALDFIRRFKFVRKAAMIRTQILASKGQSVDEQGYYRYIDSGPPEDLHLIANDIDYVLIPNTPLERGIRLEHWLPEFHTNWDLMKDFQFHSYEVAKAESIVYSLKPFCVFYLGPEGGNTVNGHNRGPMWRPEDWVELGRQISKLGMKIAVVGAYYDSSYYDDYVEPLLQKDGQRWFNLIGHTTIGETFAIIERSEFVISYQSGIGIVAEYLGVPAAIWWRPYGNSISPHFFLSFDEKMNGAWAPPYMIQSKKHFPLYYGRQTPKEIADEISERGWV